MVSEEKNTEIFHPAAVSMWYTVLIPASIPSDRTKDIRESKIVPGHLRFENRSVF